MRIINFYFFIGAIFFFHGSVTPQSTVHDYALLKCATSIYIEYENSQANSNLSKHSESIYYLLSNSTKSVATQTYISPSGIFQLNYETTGANSVPIHDHNLNGTPDYIEQIAGYFDYSLKLLIDSLGFTAPLIDNKKYQIEFRDISAAGGTIKDPDDERYTKIILNNDLIKFGRKCGNVKDSMGLAKVTVAHELKHAVQYVYNSWRDKNWLLELDATWFEDFAYDEVDNYFNFLTASHITNPGSSFSNGMGYGNCIWMHYLTQTYGSQINREIWGIASNRENSSFTDSTHYNIFNEVLLKYGITLESALTEYFIWNYFSGTNSSSQMQSYKDSKFYPTPKSCTIIREPSSSGLLHVRQKLSADFIKILKDAIVDPFEIKLSFENSANSVVLILKHFTGTYDIKYLKQEGDSVYYSSKSSLKDVEEIVLIPISISSSSNNFNYTYLINPAIVDNDFSGPIVSVFNHDEQLDAAGFPFYITADITDKSGIDTAYIEYRFDNSNFKNTKLNRFEDNTYGAYITLDSIASNNTKELYYRIIAVDSSTSRNVSFYPIEGYCNIKINNGLFITSLQHNDKMITEYILFQNNPNPFNPSTIIRYGLPEESRVELRIYNILGQEVRTLYDGIRKAGYHEETFNGMGLSSGIYIYSLVGESTISNKKYSQVKKMLMVK